jgi:phenylpropionate dioxygenase-like ring-hydroxylating dioxygenase large terminal subunit
MEKLLLMGKQLPPLEPPALSADPDWKQCDPAFIRRALDRALERPSGGWYAVDATGSLTDKPRLIHINGEELVAYRIDGASIVARHACPHLGGPLSLGKISNGKLVCPWHGLRLPSPDHGHWQPLKTHDDGVLSWVRMGPEEQATPAPILPVRPKFFIDSVIRRDANCEASGILANRMDPWHGAHYHPHTFARLKVTEVTLDLLRVRVAFRVWGRFCIEVDATFHSPEPRTIVMTIVDGEGAGSVVETHSTPVAPGRSIVIEATLATSDRPGFRYALKAARFIRPLMARAAHKLWIEDVAYAERAYALQQGRIPGSCFFCLP